MDAQTFLIIAVVVAGGYIWFLNRLNRLVQPIRLSMADLGESMLDSESLAPEIRKQVRFYLDNAFEWWPTLAGVLIFPLAYIVILFGRTDPVEIALARSSVKDRANYNKVAQLFTASQIAANPIFFLILSSEVVLCLILTVIIGRPLETVKMALEGAVRIDATLSARATAT